MKSTSFHHCKHNIKHLKSGIWNLDSITRISARITCIAILCLLQFSIQAQGSISINTTGAAPDSSAILDLQSTSKGLLVPRLTTVQRQAIVGAATGLIVYDLDKNSFWCYAGSSWIEVLAGFTTLVRDADDDTKVVVENTPDEDTIRFTVAGAEMAKMDGKTFHLNAPGKSLFIGDGTGIVDNGNFNYNVGIGRQVLNLNVNGKFNTGVGAQSLVKTNGGSVNSAFGYLAMTNNTTGNNNSSFGAQSLQFNTMGLNNHAFGHRALLYNTTGSGNIGIGYNANHRNQTGSNNTVVGTEAGGYDSFHSKSGNVFLGYRAGYNETGDNKLYIHNDSTSTPLIYGDFVTGVVNINGRLTANEGFSDMDEDTRVEVEATPDEDTIRFIVGGTEMARLDGKTMHLEAPGNSVFIGRDAGINDDSTNNRNVFIGQSAGTSNTSGGLNTFIGTVAGRSNIGGSSNTFLGWAAGFSNESGSSNSFVGYSSGYSNTSGTQNTFLGISTGELNSDGNNNTFMGSHSGAHNTSGDDNISIGYEALNQNTTGNENIAIGRGSMTANVNGIENTAIGTWALAAASTSLRNTAIGHYSLTNTSGGADNTAVGHNSMLTNHTGEENSAFGAKSLESNTSGVNNTAIGFEAMKDNTDGYYNVAIGSESLKNNDSGESNTALGAIALQSNTSGDDNIGIGLGALTNNTQGNRNIGVGFEANRFNLLGNNNVAIGHEAGRGTTSHSKSGNVFIGYQAGYNESGNNKLYIENSNSASPLIYGEFDNNKVDINGGLSVTKNGSGTAPQLLLHESNTTDYARLNFQNDSGASRWTIAGKTAVVNADAELNFYNSAFGGNVMKIRGDGKIGIGADSPETKLHIAGGTDSGLTSGGYLTIGSVNGSNISIDDNEIMARNNDTTGNLYMQNNGGDFNVHYALAEINEFVVKGNGRTGIGENNPLAKLHVNSSTGEDAMRVQINGATKMKVSSNGGTAIGVNATPPVNGLYVSGNIKMDGTDIESNNTLKLKSSTRIEIIVGVNTIVIDPVTGITITSDDDITFDAANDINFIAGNEIDLSANGDITLDSEKDVIAFATSDILLNAMARIDLDAGTELELNSTTTMDVNSDSGIEIDGGGNVDIDGAFVRLETEGNTSRQAATVNSDVNVPGCAGGCTGTVSTGSATVLIGN